MEKSNKNPEISPEQLEVICNISHSLAEGQNALTKLLAGRSLEDLSDSERKVVDKLLTPETKVETPIQPTPTTISSETAQIVRSAQAETTEQLSEQQKQIIKAWQKASEFGKKATSEQMDDYKLNRKVKKIFEEELGSLGKRVKYGAGARIMYVPCTDNDDIEWYGVIHPTSGGHFGLSFSKFFRPEKKFEAGARVNTSNLEPIKPLAIIRSALFRAGEDSLHDVERFIPGTVKLRE